MGLRWLYTQDGGLMQSASIGLLACGELYVSRAPAATTLATLHSGAIGSVEMRINTSKSADAMMRTAPTGYIAGARVQEETANSAWGTQTATKLGDAIRLAEGDTEDRAAIASLGTGKTAERTLAIGQFCALRHEDSFTETVRTAVDHSGDSSVITSVAGQIAGAALGRPAVPNDCLSRLELAATIEEYGVRIGTLRGML